jgi:hypothetical protein
LTLLVLLTWFPYTLMEYHFRLTSLQACSCLTAVFSIWLDLRYRNKGWGYKGFTKWMVLVGYVFLTIPYPLPLSGAFKEYYRSFTTWSIMSLVGATLILLALRLAKRLNGKAEYEKDALNTCSFVPPVDLYSSSI